MGAWIEILNLSVQFTLNHVAPFVGAWIEIRSLSIPRKSAGSLPSWERGLKFDICYCVIIKTMSLPSWERGLKLLNSTVFVKQIFRRSLRGSVD